MKHTSIIKLTLPPHRILYTGLSLSEANRAAREGRAIGYRVTTAGKPVTGSRRLIYHYTVVGVAA